MFCYNKGSESVDTPSFLYFTFSHLSGGRGGGGVDWASSACWFFLAVGLVLQFDAVTATKERVYVYPSILKSLPTFALLRYTLKLIQGDAFRSLHEERAEKLKREGTVINTLTCCSSVCVGGSDTSVCIVCTLQSAAAAEAPL